MHVYKLLDIDTQGQNWAFFFKKHVIFDFLMTKCEIKTSMQSALKVRCVPAEGV